ncbi:MAG: pilus assembly PilX family protein [Lysobacter sp.]
MHSARFRRSNAIRRQRGAVLYVALTMLVLLALLGISALQVTGLQERMTANYRATSRAFQNAEAAARGLERTLLNQVNSSGREVLTLDQPLCADASFDITTWARNAHRSGTSHTRRIDHCTTGLSSASFGKEPRSEDPNLIFQVTAAAVDDAGDAGSEAVIDTIFVP